MKDKKRDSYDYGVVSPREYALSDVFKERYSNLWSVLGANCAELLSLNIKVRGADDFVAVLKRSGFTGAPEVVFGSGTTVWNCLAGLDSAVAAGKWRIDKPYTDTAGRGM